MITDNDKEKQVECKNGENSVSYTFSVFDPDKIHLEFDFVGDVPDDRIIISQRGSWDVMPLDDPDDIAFEQEVTGGAVFKKEDKIQPQRIGVFYDPAEAGDSSFSSEGAALRIFSAKNLNTLKSGLEIVTYSVDEQTNDEIIQRYENFLNPVEIKDFVTIKIGETELRVDENSEIDLTSILNEYLEGNQEIKIEFEGSNIKI